MSNIACPHCHTTNLEGNAYCESCGKALPQATGGPRVVTGDALPTSAAGQSLMREQLTKQMRQVFWVLLLVGLIQLTCGAILIVALQKNQGLAGGLPALLIAQFIVAAGFIGLAMWSRKSPLSAAIVGLVVYCTLVAVNVVSAVSQMGQGVQGGGFGGLGIGILDIVIIVILAKGIQAAIKARRLKDSVV